MRLALTCVLLAPLTSELASQDRQDSVAQVAALVVTATGADTPPVERLSAMRALANDPTLRGVPALVQKLGGTTESGEQHRAILALVGMGPAVALPVQEALASDDAVVRRNAAAVLACVGDPRVTPSLLAAAGTDPSEQVRGVASGAARALGATDRTPTEAFVAASKRYLASDAAAVGPLFAWRDGALVALDVPEHLRAIRLGQKMARAAMQATPESAAARAAYGDALLAEAAALERESQPNPEAKARIAMLRVEAQTIPAATPTDSRAERLPATAVAGVELPMPVAEDPLHLKVARGGEILVRLTARETRELTAVRIVQGSRSTVSTTVTGVLGPWVIASRELILRASPEASLGTYRIEGLVRSTPRLLLPIVLEVTARTSSPFVPVPTITDLARALPTAERLSRVKLTMLEPVGRMGAYRRALTAIPADPILATAQNGTHPSLSYVAPESVTGSFDFTLTPGDISAPYIDDVVPASPGKIGGTVELIGGNLPSPQWLGTIEVYLGSQRLKVLESTTTHVIARLPIYATCGPLRAVSGSDGAEIVCFANYQVSTFQPFDYFEPDATNYSKVNSYLLALAAQRVYVKADNSMVAASETPDKYFKRLVATFGAHGMTVTDVIHDGNFGFFGWTDTQGVVMQNSQTLIVALSGTQLTSLSDPLLDALCSPHKDSSIGDSWVHSGFWLGQQSPSHNNASVYETILASARQAGGRKVWLTGHSLGGAMAHIVALRLMRDGVSVQGVITFAAPQVAAVASLPPNPPLVGANFATLFDNAFQEGGSKRAWRVTTHGDPVPLFPPPGMGGTVWGHCGRVAFFKADETLAIEPTVAAQSFVPMPWGVLTDHLEYWDRVENDFLNHTSLGRDFRPYWTRVNPSPPQ